MKFSWNQACGIAIILVPVSFATASAFYEFSAAAIYRGESAIAIAIWVASGMVFLVPYIIGSVWFTRYALRTKRRPTLAP
jgi:hypothetical protein